jgi:hypothetical protein
MKIGRGLICLRVPSALALLIAVGGGAAGQEMTGHPFVSPIFGDSMVLQREKPNSIWGWSEPGDNIRVDVGGNSAAAVAGADGKWQTKVQPPDCRRTVHDKDHGEAKCRIARCACWRRLDLRRTVQHAVRSLASEKRGGRDQERKLSADSFLCGRPEGGL